MDNREEYLGADWKKSRKQNPHPDYLSSSRKRLAPQLIFKGGILHAWGCKQAVAVHSGFYKTLPHLPEVEKSKADMAWLIYDLEYDSQRERYNQVLTRTVYTEFKSALDKITISEPGPIDDFLSSLQSKLTKKLEGASLEQLSDEPDILDRLAEL